MAWDDIISRGVWVIIQPSNLLILILLFSFLILNLSHKNSNPFKWAKKASTCSLIILFLAGFTNLSSWLLWPLEGRFEDYINKDNNLPFSGIIVLGGAEETTISSYQNQVTFNGGSERLTEAAKLARRFPGLPIIHSGSTRENIYEFSENDVAELFFINEAIDLSRIRFDRLSYNTRSNALESRKLISPTETGTWLLVTSAYHMPRSVGAFQEAGIKIQPYPVDFKTSLKYDGIFEMDAAENLKLLDLVIHEYVGLFAYYITGRSTNLFPEIE